MGGNNRTILPTRLIFTSDNGTNKTGSSSRFCGFKGNLFEGGIRVPCIGGCCCCRSRCGPSRRIRQLCLSRGAVNRSARFFIAGNTK